MRQSTITTKAATFDVDADTVRFEPGWLHYTNTSGWRVAIPSTEVLDVRTPSRSRAN